MTICLDFDGTCVSHDFPRIGKDIGAVPVLKKLVEQGHRIVLFTMRSDVEKVSSDDYNIHKQPGKYLSEAVQWFREKDIPLYGININPSQLQWTTSPKAYGEYYIDDAAIGCPLVYPKEGRPYVDWKEMEKLLIAKGVLQYENVLL